MHSRVCGRRYPSRHLHAPNISCRCPPLGRIPGRAPRYSVSRRRFRILADVHCRCKRQQHCGAGSRRCSRGRDLYRSRSPRNPDQRSRFLPVSQDPHPESARFVSIPATIENFRTYGRPAIPDEPVAASRHRHSFVATAMRQPRERRSHGHRQKGAAFFYKAAPTSADRE